MGPASAPSDCGFSFATVDVRLLVTSGDVDDLVAIGEEFKPNELPRQITNDARQQPNSKQGPRNVLCKAATALIPDFAGKT
jgi:hypothetical protein